MKLYRYTQVALLSALLLVAIQPLNAQEDQKQSRQQRIQDHQDRIKRILEQARQRRDEATGTQQAGAAEPPAAPGQPSTAEPTPTPEQQPPPANRPGQALPTGPVQNAKMTPPIQQGAPTPAAQAPQAPRSESRTILLFHPMDSIVSVGETFKTDILAETKEGEIDEISVLLKYPRHVLNPLALDHSALDPYIKKTFDYEFDPDAGTIYFHAKLDKPRRFAQKSVVSLVWEALEPSDGSTISYQFADGKKTTQLYLKGTRLLGTLPGAEDGVIKTTVQVLGPKTKATITKLEDGLMIGAKPPIHTDDRPNQAVSLELKPSVNSVHPGEDFDVDIVLKNPGEKRIDRVRLYLQFDPTALEVEDSDLGNVVTRGININDSQSTNRFPFDFYRYNYADNNKGVIVYEVSASSSMVRGSGVLATIRLKALKDTPRTEIVLVKNGQGLVPTTNVSFLGESQLKVADSEVAVPLQGVALQVTGKAVANKEEAAKNDVYNPFISNLARRMRSSED